MSYAPPTPSCIPVHPGIKSEFRSSGPWPHIRYFGRRDDLIAAGVATADMFPLRIGKRKSARTLSRHEPSRFSVNRRGAQFLVTRWAYWNDPESQARLLENERARFGPTRLQQPVPTVTSKPERSHDTSRTAHLSDEAISIAEGWSILPPRMKAHFQLIIND